MDTNSVLVFLGFPRGVATHSIWQLHCTHGLWAEGKIVIILYFQETWPLVYSNLLYNMDPYLLDI